MMPLRFKAVCTETGREFGADNLMPEATYFKHGNLVQRYWLEYLGDADTEPKIYLCQSTGLTDGNGQEVFFGDVLFYVCAKEIGDEDIIGNMRIIEFDGIKIDFFCYFDSSQDDGYKDFHRYLSHHVVIGNRWMPADELKARAEQLTQP